MAQPERAHGWPARLAIVGLCVMAIEYVLAGLGFAAIGSGILGGSSQAFASVALPLLVGALLVALPAIMVVAGLALDWRAFWQPIRPIA